jgi:hypothetical protein
MRTQTPSARQRRRGLFVLLSACAVGAAAAAVALDWYGEARRRWVATQGPPPDPSAMTKPDVSMWVARPITPGTTAPDFSLTDARTGRRVSLSEQRGRPVVLLLSSFG